MKRNTQGLAAATVILLVAALGAVIAASASAGVRSASAKTQVIKVVVKSDVEHAKKGSDGAWHDAFLPANFTVHAGERVVVHVYNYDGAAHSFRSAGLGMNVIILPGSAKAPKETTFSFVAKKKGVYRWNCDPKCDPWAMVHEGFMRGVVKVI